jgi:AcrR family transcriptional regulator
MYSERQQQILDEAINLINEKGIQGLTIKNLSKKIGISEPALYRHFESKIEILLSILNEFKEMAITLGNVLDNMDGTTLEKINIMFSSLLELFSESPSMVSVIFSEEIFKNENVLKEGIFEIMNLHTQTLEKIIEDGQANNTIRNDIDKNHLTLMVMGAIRLLVKKWDLSNHSFNLKTEGNKLVGVLTKVIGI